MFIHKLYLVAFEPRIVWLPFLIEQQQFSMGPIYVGHGIRKMGSLPHQEISLLKQKYAQDEILSKTFDIMEGADLAIASGAQKPMSSPNA